MLSPTEVWIKQTSRFSDYKQNYTENKNKKRWILAYPGVFKWNPVFQPVQTKRLWFFFLFLFALGELEKELYIKYIAKFRKERLDISTEMDTLDFEKSNLKKRVEKYAQILCNLPQIWGSNGYKGKLELQKLLFPNGLEYDREIDDYRTPEFNYVAFEMARIERDLSKKVKGDFDDYSQKSPFVPCGLKFSNFLEDFNRIRKLKAFMGI